MDEYIKREEALNALLNEMVGTGYQSRAMDAIKFIPTADVVPKSEVEKAEAEIERLKHILNCYALQYGTVIEQQAVIDKANQEFASEIFAEIERIRLKEIYKCETLRERENEVLQRKYWEGGYNSLRQLSHWFAELKKKYTEGDQ